MSDSLELIRGLSEKPSDAIRWACLLESTAPKAGNVFPGRPFQDLAYVDFVHAAEITAQHFADEGLPISQRMLSSVEDTVKLTKTNVNLGIVLLLGPLVGADEWMTRRRTEVRNVAAWQEAIAKVLASLDGTDGQRIYQTIDTASAGGLGRVNSMDVATTAGDVDIVAAMTLAQQYDRIARQYAGGFVDVCETVVPAVLDSIDTQTDILAGISRAHIVLLAQEPDSLISRKNGERVAASVQSRARQVNLDDPEDIASFDESLRGSGHQLNPGTTADLMVAALYLLLRTPST